jgi:hypothetical protein
MISLDDLNKKIQEVTNKIDLSLEQIKQNENNVNQLHANHNALIGQKLMVEELLSDLITKQDEDAHKD